ncbi:hypothetical protein M0P48_02735 [Candidatus Gracilibacteria bacterium]|jgi:hypothetical protein|nr:hypothetical protein [Candidatus Gracilibacteria bacterium]
MGVGGKKPVMKEIDETRAAGRDDAFEAIVQKITDAGGEITEDETHPLYIDIGMQEFETGTERKIKFNMHKMDFELTRRKETSRLQGMGNQKYLEDNPSPKITLNLRRKSELSSEWQSVDLDALM